MVYEGDVHCLAGFHKPMCKFLVLPAWHQCATGMIVTEDNGCALAQNCLTKHLPHIHCRTRDSTLADTYRTHIREIVAKKHQMTFFMSLVLKFRTEIIGYGLRIVHALL